MASESAVMTRIELGAYAVTDDFFGAPFIDVDKDNESPTPHRYIHGSFEGTATLDEIARSDAQLHHIQAYTDR